MSLINYASPWNNNDLPNSKKKPTMKRASSKVKPYNNYNNSNNNEINIEQFSENMKESENYNNENSEKIKNLINQVSSDNDGDKLSNYEPLTLPDITINDEDKEDNSSLYLDPNNLLPKTIEKQHSNFSSNDIPLGNLSNYKETYKPRISNIEPYYSKMGIGNDPSKVIEKINYMIHLLEEQQIEKTANITEEFILYTFLGVFVIFIVDSFTKAGKYTR